MFSRNAPPAGQGPQINVTNHEKIQQHDYGTVVSIERTDAPIDAMQSTRIVKHMLSHAGLCIAFYGLTTQASG